MGGLFVILVNIVKLSCIITTVSSIEICSNETQTGEVGEVTLTNMYNSGGSCGCSVKLAGGDKETLNVTFQALQDPAGCQYKLMFNFNTVTREYSCKNHSYQTTFAMKPTDQLYVYMVNDRNNTSSFVLNITIKAKTNGPQVNLTCRSPWTKPLITTQTRPSQTSTSQISTTQTSPTQTSTTQTSTTQTSPTQTPTSQTPPAQPSPSQTSTNQTTAVSSVEICSNATQTRREVILYNLLGSGGSCGCSVKLVGGENDSLVTFQLTRGPESCQYKLMFNLKTVTREYSCSNHKTPYQFTLTSTDILYVYLMNDRNGSSGFLFDVNIQTQNNDRQVNLTCRSPWTKPLVTTHTPTTIQTAITQTSPTTGDNNIHYTSTTGTSGESESTETTDRSKTTVEYQNSDLSVIVGCTVGGVVLVCVVVVIVICFLKRRKQKSQTDQNLSHQNLTDGNLYSNNIYDNSSPTQHQNTVDRNSYSDCYDHIPNDSLQIRNKNQVVMMSNNNTDSLDNDDYSKYGETASEHYERVPEQLEHGTNTDVEYAVVQKKTKKRTSQDKAFELNNSGNKRIVHDDYENVPKDDLNLKREINRIVGPKGDDYTLVNKC